MRTLVILKPEEAKGVLAEFVMSQVRTQGLEIPGLLPNTRSVRVQPHVETVNFGLHADTGIEIWIAWEPVIEASGSGVQRGPEGGL